MSQVVLSSAASENARRAGTPGILVADDEELLRTVLQLVLRRQGFNVWVAANGAEAEELYRQYAEHIDLVLLDVRMPVLDGPATLAALRRQKPDLRCCFMSGDTGDVTPADLLALGAERVFDKPFSIVEAAKLMWAMVS